MKEEKRSRFRWTDMIDEVFMRRPRRGTIVTDNPPPPQFKFEIPLDEEKNEDLLAETFSAVMQSIAGGLDFACTRAYVKDVCPRQTPSECARSGTRHVVPPFRTVFLKDAPPPATLRLQWPQTSLSLSLFMYIP